MQTDDAAIALLLDEDEDKRYDAAWEMIKTNPPALETLLAWTADTRPRLRAIACYCLRERDIRATGSYDTTSTPRRKSAQVNSRHFARGM
jgi:hypothetical protein